MRKKDTRIGKGAPDLPGGAMNSEHESDAERTPPRAANRTEKDGSGPTDGEAGKSPQELGTTDRRERGR